MHHSSPKMLKAHALQKKPKVCVSNAQLWENIGGFLNTHELVGNTNRQQKFGKKHIYKHISVQSEKKVCQPRLFGQRQDMWTSNQKLAISSFYMKCFLHHQSLTIPCTKIILARDFWLFFKVCTVFNENTR